MTYTYTKLENENGSVCIRAEDGNGLVLLIPADPANSDYQEYLKSLKDSE